MEDHVVVDDVPGMGSLMRARFVEKGVDDGGGGSGSIEGPEMARYRLKVAVLMVFWDGLFFS